MGVLSPDAEIALRGAPIASLDFETTGPDPRTCVPVQVAVVHGRLGDTQPEVVLRLFVDPGVPIPPESTAVHHITDDMVRGAPTWPEAARVVLEALEGRVLAAFNLPFDWQVLARGIAELPELAAVPFGTLDPLVWAKTVHRYEKSKKLVDVCGRYGIPIDAHDAAGDALATALVMPRLLHDLGRHASCGRAPLLSVGAMWAWTVRQAIADEQGYAAWRKGKGLPPPTLYWEELTGGGRAPSGLS